MSKVSIITPVKDLIKDGKKDKLLACLKSVKAQDFADIEHIIVAGSSSDATMDLLKEQSAFFSFKIISEVDSSIPEALSNGVRKATGDFVMFLNVGDSLMFPEALTQTVFLLQSSNADFVYGDIQTERPDKQNEILPATMETFFVNLPFYLQSTCIKMPVLQKLMPFDNSFTFNWDYDFVLRLLFSGAMGVKNPQITACVFTRLFSLDKVEKIRKETLDLLSKYYIPSIANCTPEVLKNLVYSSKMDLDFYQQVMNKIAPAMKQQLVENLQKKLGRQDCFLKYAAEGYKQLYMPLQGIGDALVFSPIARAIAKATGHKVLVGTSRTELFENNPYVETTDVIYDSPAVVSEGLVEKIKESGLELVHPSYWILKQKKDGHYDVTYPNRNMFVQTAMRAGFTGKIDAKPEIYLTEEEKKFGRFAPFWRKQIAIMSTAKEGQKQWEHFPELVEILKYDYDFVQIGAKDDKILDGAAYQKAGELTLRQTACVLYNSDLFIGEIGGLMHLARAVDCPSVIAFSSAEPTYFSAYIANKNVQSDFECKLPRQNCIFEACNHCPNHRRCTDIPIDRMLSAVRAALAEEVGDLPYETFEVKGALLENSIQEHFLRYKALLSSRK